MIKFFIFCFINNKKIKYIEINIHILDFDNLHEIFDEEIVISKYPKSVNYYKFLQDINVKYSWFQMVKIGKIIFCTR